MIPKDWQFKGRVNVGVAEGGRFGDWFSVVGDATAGCFWPLKLLNYICAAEAAKLQRVYSRVHVRQEFLVLPSCETCVVLVLSY
jgi:hypothetical protein